VENNQGTEPTPVLLGHQKAAVLMGVSPKQLELMARRLDIAHIVIDGELYFTREAIRTWIARHERRAW